jgi:hypothetical protein
MGGEGRRSDGRGEIDDLRVLKSEPGTRRLEPRTSRRASPAMAVKMDTNGREFGERIEPGARMGGEGENAEHRTRNAEY